MSVATAWVDRLYFVFPIDSHSRYSAEIEFTRVSVAPDFSFIVATIIFSATIPNTGSSELTLSKENVSFNSRGSTFTFKALGHLTSVTFTESAADPFCEPNDIDRDATLGVAENSKNEFALCRGIKFSIRSSIFAGGRVHWYPYSLIDLMYSGTIVKSFSLACTVGTTMTVNLLSTFMLSLRRLSLALSPSKIFPINLNTELGAASCATPILTLDVR